MKSNKSLIFLFFLLILSNALILVKIIRITSDYKEYRGVSLSVQEKLESYIDEIKKKEMVELKSECYRLPMKIGDSISLDKPVLVLRFSEKDCFNCYSDALYVIKKGILKLPSDQVLVLGNFKNSLTLRAFAYENIKPEVQVFNYVENLVLPVEDLNKPYAFLLFPNRQIQKVYSFDKNNMEMLELYINNVVEKIKD